MNTINIELYIYSIICIIIIVIAYRIIRIFYYRIALAIPTTDQGRERCRMYAVNYSELLQQQINVSDPSWPTMPCRDGWEYNYTEVPYASIASEVSIRKLFSFVAFILIIIVCSINHVLF